MDNNRMRNTAFTLALIGNPVGIWIMVSMSLAFGLVIVLSLNVFVGYFAHSKERLKALRQEATLVAVVTFILMMVNTVAVLLSPHPSIPTTATIAAVSYAAAAISSIALGLMLGTAKRLMDN